MTSTVRQVRRTGKLEQARQLSDQIRTHQQAIRDATRRRRALIVALHAEGMSDSDIAAELGLSRQAVQAIRTRH